MQQGHPRGTEPTFALQLPQVGVEESALTITSLLFLRQEPLDIFFILKMPTFAAKGVATKFLNGEYDHSGKAP